MFNIKNYKRQDNIINYVFIILIITGSSLAIYQFFYNRNLWMDEAWLARNIISRDFLGLLKPLDNIQIAPIGFLYVMKSFTVVFGKNEMALSIFPLIGFLGSIPLFHILTKNLFEEKLFPLFATAIFTFNPKLIYFSSEVKQYSTDVFFTLLILYTYISFRQNKVGLIFLFVVGFSVLFSNISIFILFITGSLILFDFNQSLLHKSKIKILFILLFWGVTVLIYYFTFLYNHPSKIAQIEFWSDNGFLPISSGFKGILTYIDVRVIPTFKDFLPSLQRTRFHIFQNLPLSILTLGLCFLAYKKKYTFLYLIFSIVILHLVASALKLYPFASRLTVYIIPLLLLAFSYGIYNTLEIINKFIKLPYIGYLLVCVFTLLMYYKAYKKFPMDSRSDVKSAIIYINKKLAIQDMIYFGDVGNVTFLFYKDIGFVEKKFYDKVKVFELQNERTINETHLSKISTPSWIILEKLWSWRIPDSNNMDKLLLKANLQLLEVKKFRMTNCYYVIPKLNEKQ